ncbi:OmpA family protein [Bartonella sp. HY761]|uniref:OmpA family protein n=1 Tax=Bartonella sp. HY761 TaxID=2979330 RepID=UPI0021FE7286|nr:OmpA family protein [Bartonella sp. HY761]UXN05423.1 OmpA family protein [Bartonella sp. HY761]
MRGGNRRRNREEEEESVFVSMTDMTVSFLFVVILLLAYFAQQYSEKTTVPRTIYEEVLKEKQAVETENTSLKIIIAELKKQIAQLQQELEKLKKIDPLEAYLTAASQERRKILEVLRDQLKIDFPDLDVVISEESDALRFQGDGLFATNSSTLRPDRIMIVDNLAKRLRQILPCYTIGDLSKWDKSCNPSNAIIESVQIEGHTDSTGDFLANLSLSTARANSTFFKVIDVSPQLVDFLNFRHQPVLSVAGYGQMRPVKDNTSKEGRDTNRRVDLRIIMYTPSQSAEIAKIREALGALPAIEGDKND